MEQGREYTHTGGPKDGCWREQVEERELGARLGELGNGVGKTWWA